MEALPVEIEVYVNKDGKAPFSDWLIGLKDPRARAKIRTRLDRIRLGNFSDVRSLGKGLHELRIHYGSGYRVYFGRIETMAILLLCAGDKGTQAKDINQAKACWSDYRRRKDD